ncbi:MAG: hypothetical protein HWQ23_03875 [Nostoc sp. JL33]|uniref:hypothetical protein n=1 Tax=Nostoc sp. JL33 TaxID=2815396 RepID=UPI0025DD980E|nr:hypothetical protein [Nostoc sp. JL33]MBN3869472.1 hypothetical protein [Nostoc sp. JL33]
MRINNYSLRSPLGRFFYVSSYNFGDMSKPVSGVLVTGVENWQQTVINVFCFIFVYLPT